MAPLFLFDESLPNFLSSSAMWGRIAKRASKLSPQSAQDSTDGKMQCIDTCLIFSGAGEHPRVAGQRGRTRSLPPIIEDQ